MKRIACILISVCLLLCMAACTQNSEESRVPETTGSTEGQPSVETQLPTESTAVTENLPETTTPGIVEDPDPIRLLALEKALHT